MSHDAARTRQCRGTEHGMSVKPMTHHIYHHWNQWRGLGPTSSLMWFREVGECRDSDRAAVTVMHHVCSIWTVRVGKRLITPQASLKMSSNQNRNVHSTRSVVLPLRSQLSSLVQLLYSVASSKIPTRLLYYHHDRQPSHSYTNFELRWTSAPSSHFCCSILFISRPHACWGHIQTATGLAYQFNRATC